MRIYNLDRMTGDKGLLLIVFVKNPEAGKVKTRLADTIGDTKALEIYQNLLTHTRQEALKVRADRQIWYSEYIDRQDEWESPLFSKYLQPDGNLGNKMLHAFDSGFKSGYRKIILIGSDCPTLLSDHIREAFIKLDTHDVVLGPSTDGGYYLIGLNKLFPNLFYDKSWSTSNLYLQTVEVLEKAGLTYYELEELNDIDTVEDLDSVNGDPYRTTDFR